MVASNTSKGREESNLFPNYRFPFGFYHLLRNVSYVNNCLCGFDHFGPHPAIASDQAFCLDLPNPCELITKPQMQPFSSLRQNPLMDVTGSFISGLQGAFDLLIFSQIWTHIKGAKPFKEGGKYGILSSCEPIKDRRKPETDRWADVDVALGAARSGLQGIFYSCCPGEPLFSSVSPPVAAFLPLSSFYLFIIAIFLAWLKLHTKCHQSRIVGKTLEFGQSQKVRASGEQVQKLSIKLLRLTFRLMLCLARSHVLVSPLKMSAHKVNFFPASSCEMIYDLAPTLFWRVCRAAPPNRLSWNTST